VHLGPAIVVDHDVDRDEWKVEEAREIGRGSEIGRRDVWSRRARSEDGDVLVRDGAKARGAAGSHGGYGRGRGLRRGLRRGRGRLSVGSRKHPQQQGEAEHELREPHPSHAAGIIVEKARAA